ncbi:MAG: alpha/beta fold hydrolase [Deltaproteobacteria bacterium]
MSTSQIPSVLSHPNASHPNAARRRLLAALPVEERQRHVAGISTAVLEGGSGAPLLLLHGPGGNATHFLRILPALVGHRRVIVPDLPGHGSTEPGPAPLDAPRVLAWLEALIDATCAEPPVLVGELSGGAIAARFAALHPERVHALVLVDSLGLTAFQPPPEFAQALTDFGSAPSPATHRSLWKMCARNLGTLERQMGTLWEAFETYNIECARSANAPPAVQAVMAEFGGPALAPELLAQLASPTTLIWGRHDLATPLAVARRVSARQGWPLHVIEGANDAPSLEQPDAFAKVLLAVLQEDGAADQRGLGARRRRAPAREHVDTLVIGGGQAGLATSHWLTLRGIDHLVLERRPELGGSWHDRWDSFHLVAPNFCLLLPGMPYAGPDPDAFMPRSGVLEYVREYAAFCAAPVRLGCSVERLSASDGRFEARAGETTFVARNVVLATGPYQRPKLPSLSASLPGHIQQLHSNDYRRPAQLPPGGVLVVGTGQSGTQIAEELQRAGHDVHLAVSMCPSVPRRYRGRDVIWWLLQSFLNGEKVGVPFPTVADLPTPAARFGCNPHCSGNDGGHDIHLRQFARRGMHLYGRLESADGARLRFSDDLEARLRFADTQFDAEFRPLFDAYIAASGSDAPPDDRPPPDDFLPPHGTQLDLDAAGVRSVVWATGYALDFSWVDLPVFDEWGYPRHVRGVTGFPGLYAVGLPWLHSEPSAVFAGVGADAAHVVEHIARTAAEAQVTAQAQVMA